MGELVQNINQNYAALISCLISLVTAITTIIYVVFTHHQMKATQESVKLMQIEMKQARQPCIAVSINRVYSGKAIPSNGRRQMPVEFTIENIGDAPALSVFSISHLELQNVFNKDGNKNVEMFSGPLLTPFLRAGESAEEDLHYENKQIDLMFTDLAATMDKNWERIKNNPYQPSFHGTEIIIQVYYKNLNDQWFESRLKQEIAWGYDNYTKNKTKHNLNEFTFPPRVVKNEDEFELQLCSPKLSPLNIQMVSREEVEKELLKYKDEWPDVFRG